MVAGAKVMLAFIAYHPYTFFWAYIIIATILQLLDKCAVVTEMPDLPSIDNNYNQMEVAEYVEEIYHYYWVTEVMFVILSKKNWQV